MSQKIKKLFLLLLMLGRMTDIDYYSLNKKFKVKKYEYKTRMYSCYKP